MSPRIGSLFSGYGGLDIGVQAVLGGEVVWHCENEDAPSRILAHHWPDIPNLGDITKVDWDRVEPVDVMTAGWPCQPFSLAGKRKGAADERALWPHVSRAIRVARPPLVVLENVTAVLTAGEFQRVADSMAALRYDFRWTCLRASDVGAAHRRDRFFGVAYPQGERPPISQPSWPDGSSRTGESAADPTGIGHERSWRPRGRWPGPEDGCPSVPADTAGHAWRLAHGDDVAPTHPDDRAGDRERSRPEPRRRSDTDWGIYELAIRRAERAFGRSVPDPTEPGRGGPRLSPRFVEWHMGLPAGWVTEVPGISRTDQLRALGNGVVPQQAAMALRWLLSLDREVAA